MLVFPIALLALAASGCDEALPSVAAALQQRDLARASTLLQELRPKCAGSSGFHTLAGLTSGLDKRYSDAATDLQQALSLNPRLAGEPSVFLGYAEALIETDQASRLVDFLAGQNRALSPPLLFSLGTLYARHRNYPEAISCFQRIPATVADDAVYFNLGLAHSYLRHYETARKYYFLAIDQHPSHAEAYFRVGLDYAAAGDLRKSLPWLLRAKEFAPGRPDISYALVTQLLYLNYLDTANQIAVQALAANPEEPLLLSANGDVAVSQAKNGAAIDFYQKALNLNPNLPSAIIGLARVDKLNANNTDARKRLMAALVADPQNVAMNGELGALEAEDGDWNSAYLHLSTSWSADHSNLAILLPLARTLDHLKRAGDALLLLQPFSSAFRESLAFHSEMSQIYSKLGKNPDAVAEREMMAILQAKSSEGIRFDAPKAYVY